MILIYDDGFTEYDVPPSYSFSGGRFRDFYEYFTSHMLEDRYELERPTKASKEDLLLIHTEEYLNYVEQLANEIPGSFTTYLTPDTQVERGMLEANKLIVGAAMDGVERAGRRDMPVYTFGGLHHAGPSRGGGFCVLNDVAAAARHARNIYRGRVMIIDTDAHAGDGTMDIFYKDPSVLTISVHHDPTSFYPGRGFAREIGDGEGEGYCVNFPMPPFAGINCYEIFREQILEPIAREYRPKFIIRNGGSDPYFSDIPNLGYATFLGLRKRDFHTLGGWIGDLSRSLGAYYLDIMGSGYDVDAIPTTWFALMTGSLGVPYEGREKEDLPGKVDDEERIEATQGVADNLKELLGPYWSSLG
jgi:acetoin utilization protein AcuC